MKATIPYIEKKFAEFNAKCFGGKLAPLPIRLGNGRSFLGKLMYKRRRVPFNWWRYYDFVLVISTRFDLPEEVVEDTILHEMIHYYIHSHRMEDTSAHGKIFRRMMNNINRRYKRHITIRHKYTAEEQESDTERRQHFVCVSALSDGRTGVTLAAHTRLLQLWDALPQVPSVSECSWYITSDPFFNRFPRSITPKIYAASDEEVRQHLESASRLIRTGNQVRMEDENQNEE